MPSRVGSSSPPPSAAVLAGRGPSLPPTPLVVVTGKGGVGRSSTATSIAVGLAQRGERVALVHPSDAPPVEPPPWAPRTIDVIGVDRDHALTNYMAGQLPGPFAAALRASRAFNLLAAATPGLAELLTLGELRRLVDGPYDRLVFDAPATGHLLALLDAPRRFERAAAVGPIAGRARLLGDWISDPEVATMVCVTTGDSLAVSELLDLISALEERVGHRPGLVVANRIAPASPPAAELEAMEATGADPAGLAAVEALAARGRSERAQLGRLTKAIGRPAMRALERPGSAVSAILASFAEDDPDLHGQPTDERRQHDLPGTALRRADDDAPARADGGRS